MAAEATICKLDPFYRGHFMFLRELRCLIKVKLTARPRLCDHEMKSESMEPAE